VAPRHSIRLPRVHYPHIFMEYKVLSLSVISPLSRDLSSELPSWMQSLKLRSIQETAPETARLRYTVLEDLSEIRFWKRRPEQVGYEYAIIFEASCCSYSHSVLDNITFEHTKAIGRTHQLYELGTSVHTLGYHPHFVLARFLKYILTGQVTGRTNLILYDSFLLELLP